MASSLLDPSWQLPGRLVNTPYGPPSPEGLQREQEGGALRERLDLPATGSMGLEQPPHFASGTAYVEMLHYPSAPHISGDTDLRRGLLLERRALQKVAPGFRWRAMEKVSESMLHLGPFTSSHPCP